MFPLYDLAKSCGLDINEQLSPLNFSKEAYCESYNINHESNYYWLALFYYYEGKQNLNFRNSGEILSVLQGYSISNPTKYKMLILKMYILECERTGEEYLNKEVEQFYKSLEDCIEQESEVDFFRKRFQDSHIDFSFLKGKEKLVITLLKEKSRSKFELIEGIYGKSCDFIASEKRFKALLSRLRKKITCELILNTHGEYQLVL